ncbi:Two-component transcriptional response regulator, LuxR family [hydrothermal vent metagenome]|uniref:Two-component transcriptional response regulator, LuxR family n=1 Tax=hydrothermal vent metagenome TaxID=652676 RepID=A0A3B1AIA3_9ZZZZ
MQTYTLILVEDDADVRDRLVQLVVQHEHFELLATAGNVAEGLAALEKHKPDILLIDLGLPDGSGIDIIKAIDEQCLDCEAMVISGFQDEHRVFSALEAGAKAYILKHDKSQKITDAIIHMMKGGAPISPVIARLMLQKFQAPKPHERGLPEALTRRQIDILKLVSQGFSSQEIAEKLDIRYYTVTTHIKNIYNKLQVNSRTEALFEAGRLGLLP